jgi:hypothetical protein
MKALCRPLVLCYIFMMAQYSQAQVTRLVPRQLFNDYSATIAAPVSELEKAFSAAAGSSVQFNFSSKFSFSGTVMSSLRRYTNLYSVIVSSPLLHDALLSISKIINNDNTVTYVGRILNDKYADGYILKKDNTGNYSFNKIKTTDLIQDY